MFTNEHARWGWWRSWMRWLEIELNIFTRSWQISGIFFALSAETHKKNAYDFRGIFSWSKIREFSSCLHKSRLPFFLVASWLNPACFKLFVSCIDFKFKLSQDPNGSQQSRVDMENCTLASSHQSSKCAQPWCSSILSNFTSFSFSSKSSSCAARHNESPDSSHEFHNKLLYGIVCTLLSPFPSVYLQT